MKGKKKIIQIGSDSQGNPRNSSANVATEIVLLLLLVLSFLFVCFFFFYFFFLLQEISCHFKIFDWNLFTNLTTISVGQLDASISNVFICAYRAEESTKFSYLENIAREEYDTFEFLSFTVWIIYLCCDNFTYIFHNLGNKYQIVNVIVKMPLNSDINQPIARFGIAASSGCLAAP